MGQNNEFRKKSSTAEIKIWVNRVKHWCSIFSVLIITLNQMSWSFFYIKLF